MFFDFYFPGDTFIREVGCVRIRREGDDSGWKHELELVDSENGSARTARLKKTFANTDLSDSLWTVREESGGKSCKKKEILFVFCLLFPYQCYTVK